MLEQQEDDVRACCQTRVMAATTRGLSLTHRGLPPVLAWSSQAVFLSALVRGLQVAQLCAGDEARGVVTTTRGIICISLRSQAAGRSQIVRIPTIQRSASSRAAAIVVIVVGCVAE